MANAFLLNLNFFIKLKIFYHLSKVNPSTYLLKFTNLQVFRFTSNSINKQSYQKLYDSIFQ